MRYPCRPSKSNPKIRSNHSLHLCLSQQPAESYTKTKMSIGRVERMIQEQIALTSLIDVLERTNGL